MPPRKPALAALLAATAIAAYLLWPRLPASSAPNNAPRTAQSPAEPPPAQQPPGHTHLPHRQRTSAPFPTGDAFKALKLRATRGDAHAQWELARIYDACYYPNESPGTFLADHATMAKLMKDAKDAERMFQISNARVTHCEGVDDGARIPMAALKGWYAQAAQNGSLAAKAYHYTISGYRPGPAEAQAMVEEVAASGDPAAIFVMGELVPNLGLQSGQGKAYGELASGKLAGYAWMIVGCQMGYPCDGSSLLMDNHCLFTGHCKGESLEEMVRSHIVSPADAERLNKKIEQITSLVNP